MNTQTKTKKISKRKHWNHSKIIIQMKPRNSTRKINKRFDQIEDKLRSLFHNVLNYGKMIITVSDNIDKYHDYFVFMRNNWAESTEKLFQHSKKLSHILKQMDNQ